MNKHTRLAVGILVLVLVLLIVATVSFSVNISKKSAGSQNSTFDTGTNSNGNVIVEGDDHLYGVSDAAGNLILEPEWKELHFIGSDYLSAVQEMLTAIVLACWIWTATWSLLSSMTMWRR